MQSKRGHMFGYGFNFSFAGIEAGNDRDAYHNARTEPDQAFQVFKYEPIVETCSLAVFFRIHVLDVVEKEVDGIYYARDIFKGNMSCRVDGNVDPGLPEHAGQECQSPGLYQGFTAGKRDSAFRLLIIPGILHQCPVNFLDADGTAREGQGARGTGGYAFSAQEALFLNVDSFAPVYLSTVRKAACRAGDGARLATQAQLLPEEQLGPRSLRLGVVTPEACEGTTLEEHRRAYARPVVDRESLYIVDVEFGHPSVSVNRLRVWMRDYCPPQPCCQGKPELTIMDGMEIHVWQETSLIRIFPDTPVPEIRQSLPLAIARNERFSFQVGVRNASPLPQTVSARLSGPPGWLLRLRRVGMVPVRHHNTDMAPPALDGKGRIPGYVPDPLFEDLPVTLGPGESMSFWITAKPAAASTPGNYTITTQVLVQEELAGSETLAVRVNDTIISPRHDFPVTNWFYNDCLFEFHGCKPFDEKYWRIVRNYFIDMVEHQQDTIYTPIFTPPLDGPKLPTQLVSIKRAGADAYTFDFSDVKRYIDLARDCGFVNFEWTHFFSQWGARSAIAIYDGQGLDGKRLWAEDTPADSPVYRAFLGSFLPEFKAFLIRENLLGHSFFHVSDEPQGRDDELFYSRARNILLDLAPWMQVMDALSDIEYGRRKLTDMPVTSTMSALDFMREGIPCWVYYCCGPRASYMQRLLDTPLQNIRMNGWLLYRWPARGFLHWGYNYWLEGHRDSRKPIDPYTCQDGMKWPDWAYGDPFMVYPGDDGPVDSIRWEIFSEGLQDYALMQTLGIDRESEMLSALRSYQDFPVDALWIQSTRDTLLSAGSASPR